MNFRLILSFPKLLRAVFNIGLFISQSSSPSLETKLIMTGAKLTHVCMGINGNQLFCKQFLSLVKNVPMFILSYIFFRVAPLNVLLLVGQGSYRTHCKCDLSQMLKLLLEKDFQYNTSIACQSCQSHPVNL